MKSQNVGVGLHTKKGWNNAIRKIMTAYNDISKRINPKELFEIDLTPIQIKALTCFSDEGMLSMSELSRSLGVRMPTMTAMVDRLVSAKMVERNRDSIDRRVVKVCLTDAGKKTLKKLEMIRRKELEKVLLHLNQEEVETFLTSFEMQRNC